MSKAFIGDPHGCHEELEELWWKLRGMGIAPENIEHAGDLVDRGPSSGKVVRACRQLGINGVAGNHDMVIVGHWDRWKKEGKFPTRSEDKQRTLLDLTQEDIDYMRALPHLKVHDDIKTWLVHGGLYPTIPAWKQAPQTCCRLQLIHMDHIGESRWFNLDRKGITEEEHRAQGWRRWYELWDHEYNVVFGHSGFKEPIAHQPEVQGSGKCIGVDTRCCFGGKLTAVIMPELEFVSVPAKKIWFPSDPKHDLYMEGKNG